jgi:hypothetical protein
MDPLGFGRIIADRWGILMMSPDAFAAVLGFGFLLGLTITRIFLNERLTHQQNRISDLQAVLDEKLPATLLPPRKRSKQMSFGLIAIFGGVIAILVGVFSLFLDRTPRSLAESSKSAVPVKEILKSGSSPSRVSTLERLIRAATIDWSNKERLSLQGRFTRSDGPLSVYVTYGQTGGIEPPVVINGTLSIEPN